MRRAEPALHPEAEIAALREQIERTGEHMARTLMRATRLAQVISVLGSESDLKTIVERAAIEVGELFFADMAVLILNSDKGLSIAGHWGVAAGDLPEGPFALPDVENVTRLRSVRVGPVADLPIPEWLVSYSPRHVAWVRLLVGERSLGVMLLARRGDEPFEASDATELRAIAYRIALAIENGQLHKRMTDQLAQLHRLQQLTAAFAGTLDLPGVGRRLAETLVSEAGVSSGVVLIQRGSSLEVLSTAGALHDFAMDAEGLLVGPLGARWKSFPLEIAGKSVGAVAVTDAPAVDSEPHQMLLYLMNLGTLALDKALLHEQSIEQARHDSLTGLLGHRIFHETLNQLLKTAHPFSMLMFDIDDFKQINDFHGHQIGDQALCLVADALRRDTRSGDSVFRTGGEEFCVLLPGLTEDDAFAVAEAMRRTVAAIVSTLPNPVTVSAGVASFPAHGREHDELLASVDGALYASKRSGKNRSSTAGEENGRGPAPLRREVGLELLQSKDPETVSHSLHVAILAVEIGGALGLDDARLDALRTAARLHDIGKIGVPDAILNKPGALDESEFCIIRTHPVVGAELLSIWGLARPALIVRQHHERIDGRGYPAGLRGDELLLESRILHAVDAYVAMVFDRPYRKAMKDEAAIAELVRHSGTQFDAKVVAGLIAVEQTRATSITRATFAGPGGIEIRRDRTPSVSLTVKRSFARPPSPACEDPGVELDSRRTDWIALDGAVNARAVVPDVLLRADNLQALSALDVRRLVTEEALEVVLDLRTDLEVELEGPGPMTAEPAVRIEHRSLYPDSAGNTDLEADTVKPWRVGGDGFDDESPVVRAYMSYLHRRPDSVVASLRTIARADGAVLVHCAAGKDRTGVVVALALDVAGVDRETIVADYLVTRERIDAIVARLVSSPTYRAELEGHDPQAHAPLPGTMERVLELVDERLGGSAAWLSAHGLSDPDLQRLRRRLAPARAGARPS